MTCLCTAGAFSQDLIVAKDGSGNYTTIQAAINAAPTGRTTPFRILVKKGKYVETVTIPSTKPFIQLAGQSAAETIISYDNYSGKPIPGGGSATYGTSTCATVTINANDVMLMNISVENSTAYGIDANAIVPAPGDGPQALAVYTTSDRVVFFNVRLNGGQDTFYGGNVQATRCYFKNCYIDGNTDFMFGSSTIIFDTCIIYPRTRIDNSTTVGYVTAVNTRQVSGYGYVYRDCKLTKNRGTTIYTLGRPWQNDAATLDASKSWNKVAFLNTKMGSSINPVGWSIWDAGTNPAYITNVEYNSLKYDGVTPVDVSGRISWSQQLSAAQAAKYYNNDTVFVNANTPAMTTWNPYATWPELGATAFTPELVVSNLMAKKGFPTAGVSTINWNLSWPMPGVQLDLYRSTDKVNFSIINTQTSTEDSAGNFTFSENIPPPGSAYYYIVRASKAGYTSITSDTTSVVSIPTITVTGSLGGFLQGLGTPSNSQVYTVSGANLTTGITITPPAGFEISADGGTTWYSNSLPLTLPQTSGVVANTNISVRLNATVVGTITDSIVHVTAGVATVKQPVTGTVQSTPLVASLPVIQWPMTANNTDSAAARAVGLGASTSTLNRLVLSNGTTVATVPAYSGTYGQAFGPSAAGDGSWSTGAGGPGGNLNRTYYEQFTVSPLTNYSVRIDSIILNASFYNTSSSTKMAVVYSLSGFTTDSANVTGGIGLGVALLSTANGGFTTPIALINDPAGTTSNYRLALNGSTGISLAAGQTLSIRVYMCCSSSSVGRYGKLANVLLAGQVTAPKPVITTTGTLTTFSQTLGTPSNTQTYSVSGVNLTSGISIRPPAGYQVSGDAGITWYDINSPLVLPQSGGTLANTTVTVRLNGTTAGSYKGNISHTSNGADSVKRAVTGYAQAPIVLTGQPAFPGAEGFGRLAIGGRYGTVYEVTNLNDAGVGSLRDAISQSNRTIVFKVSGTIHLASALKIKKDSITIAGQTAPGDGICIANNTTTIEGSNIILRYIRFRLGDTNGVIDDALNSYSGNYHDIVVDHCSMSWSVDETGTFYDIQNFTLQWSILSESLYHSIDPKGNHGYAGIWGGQGTTFHHNLLADHSSRNPRFSGSRYLGDSLTGTVDMRNNVIYNWGNINSAYGGEGGTQNMVNNYFKPGPATPGSTTSSNSNKRNRILNYTSYYYASDAKVYPDTLFGGQFFIDGNYVEGFPDVSADNWTLGVQSDGYYNAPALIAAARQSIPFAYAPVTTEAATSAYTSVLNGAGAILPKRDTVDRRVLKEARTGVNTFEGAAYAAVSGTGISHPSGIIDSQNDVGGWPTLNSITPPTDTDHDGMPDSWETARGLNPNDASDRLLFRPNGYTNLENYLNGDSITATATAGSCINTRSVLSTNSGNWLQLKDTISALTLVSDTTNLVASVKDNAAYGTIKASYYISGALRTLPNGRAYINRNITLVPSVTLTNPVQTTVRLYITAAEYNALKAVDAQVKTPDSLRVLLIPGSTCQTTAAGPYTVITPTATGVFGTFGNGYYIEFSTSTFGTFYIAGAGLASIPSFSLTSFTGVFSSGVTNLAWSTANEYNTQRFVIERSADTLTFTAIDSVVTKGQGANNYTYTDKAPPKGVSYYRLRIVSADGSVVYSAVIKIYGYVLLTFNAAYTNQVVKANWTTVGIGHVAYFALQRKGGTDTGFITVEINAVKDSIGHFYYQNFDTNPYAGTSYYRLKVVYIDSSFEYSQVLATGKNLTGKILVYPNPAAQQVTVAYTAATTDGTIELCAPDGHRMHTYVAPAGSTQTVINISGLANGNYILIFNNNGQRNITKFIKVN